MSDKDKALDWDSMPSYMRPEGWLGKDTPILLENGEKPPLWTRVCPFISKDNRHQRTKS